MGRLQQNKLPLRSDTSPHISNGNVHITALPPQATRVTHLQQTSEALCGKTAPQPALSRLVGIPVPFPLVSHAYLDRAVVGDDLVFHLLIPQASLCEIFQQVRIHNL